MNKERRCLSLLKESLTKEGKLFKMNTCNFASVISASEMEKLVSANRLSGSSEEEMNPSEEKHVSSEVEVEESGKQVEILEGNEETIVKIEENEAKNPTEERIEVNGSKSPVGVEHIDFKWEKLPKEVKSSECTEVNFCCGMQKVHPGAVGLGEIRNGAVDVLRKVLLGAVGLGEISHGAVAASRKAHSGVVGLCAIRFCATTGSHKVHPGVVGRKQICLGAGGVSCSVHYSVVVRVISCDAALGGTTTSVLYSAWCGVAFVLGPAMSGSC